MTKHFLDITHETCPMTFVKVKLKLAQIDKGEELEILLNAGEPLQNVPRSCEEQGYTVLSNEPTDEPGKHMLVIRK